jgi:hypothetical protein
VSSLETYGSLARRILLHQMFTCGEQQIAVYHDLPLTLNELKTVVTVFIRNISQADLQKVFANKIEQIHDCIDSRGRHFQHLL